MELILWRHTDANTASSDMARELTDTGRQQAASVAGWLNARLPPDVRILVSPAVRAIQTAQALGRDYEVLPALAPGASDAAILAVAGWPHATRQVIVVGHQPTLGQVAMRLLTGQSGDLTISKGGVWWFQGHEREYGLQVALRAVAAPDWL